MIALTLKTETIIKARTPRDGLKLQSSFFILSKYNGTLAFLSVKQSAFR